jgi:hypothetical protein
MIGKKISNPRKSASKSVRIARLTNYVLEPESRLDKQEKSVYHGVRNFITEESNSQTVEMIAVEQDAVHSKDPSKSVRIARLTNYVLESEGRRGKHEKCVYHGARNFITEESNSQTAEMIAVAQDAVRSKDPINHYVLSWPADERPTVQQIESTMDIFLKEFKMEKHLVIYSLHIDTDNYHLHIVLNRVNPETSKCVEINRGFDIEALHLAVTKIEYAHGWKPEQNALFKVTEDGNIERRKSDKSKSPNQVKVDREVRSGEKSAERIAIEKAAKIIKEATSWEALHINLAQEGFRYARFGSGAVVYVGEVTVKASSVDREASFNKLQKRLGPYQGSPLKDEAKEPEVVSTKSLSEQKVALKKAAGLIDQAQSWENLHQFLGEIGLRYVKTGSGAVVVVRDDLEVKASSVSRRASLWQLQKRLGPYQGPELKFMVDNREPEPIKPNQPGWEVYIAEKKVHYEVKEIEQIELNRRHELEKRELVERQKQERYKIFNRDWKRRGMELNALRSVVAAEQAAEKARQRDKHRQERAEFRQRYRPYPDYEQWQLGTEGLFVLAGTVYVRPQPMDIRNFDSQVVGGKAYYARTETPWKIEIVDHGDRIYIHNWRDRDTILAAEQLSSQKWGSFYLENYDYEFITICIEVAVEHGFKIINPELQDDIQKERERRQRMEKEQEKEYESKELMPTRQRPRM